MGERGFTNISDLEMSHHHHVIITININHVATVSAQVSASCSIEVPRYSCDRARADAIQVGQEYLLQVGQEYRE